MWELLALSAASGAMKGYADVAGAGSSAGALEVNAERSRQNAILAQQEANVAEEQQRFYSKQVLGQMRANVGASGIAMDGSALDVLEQSATRAELDALNIRYKGKVQALGYQQDAQFDDMRATNTRAAGKLQASADLIGSFGKMALLARMGGKGGDKLTAADYAQVGSYDPFAGASGT